MNKHNVIVSLASNRDAKQNLFKARQCLEEVLSSVLYTEELWTEPIGTKRKDLYLNQLAEGETTLDCPTLSARLKDIETMMGRTAEDRREGIVSIDLDLLSYDGTRYHERDWERPYVTQLIGQLTSNE